MLFCTTPLVGWVAIPVTDISWFLTPKYPRAIPFKNLEVGRSAKMLISYSQVPNVWPSLLLNSGFLFSVSHPEFWIPGPKILEVPLQSLHILQTLNSELFWTVRYTQVTYSSNSEIDGSRQTPSPSWGDFGNSVLLNYFWGEGGSLPLNSKQPSTPFESNFF